MHYTTYCVLYSVTKEKKKEENKAPQISLKSDELVVFDQRSSGPFGDNNNERNEKKEEKKKLKRERNIR